MKSGISIKMFVALFLSLAFSLNVQGQFLDKLKNRVKETVENKTLSKAEADTDKVLNKAEDDLKSSKRKSDQSDEEGIIILTGKEGKERQAPLTSYANYDFVPGDKLIYYYDMSGEKDAEIPSRMLIDEGSAEIQTFNGEKVLYVPANGRSYMSPQIKEKAYLPKKFTLEFDVLSNGQSNTDGAEVTLYFREKEAVSGAYGDATAPVKIRLEAISGNAFYGFEIYDEDENSSGTGSQNFPKEAINPSQNNWRRVAIYVSDNIGKLYVDQHRIGISNRVETGRAAKLDIEITTNDHPVMFRNFRIAAGGADSYNKVVTDGKFIAYGIQFDVNKATLKPESMGTINEFVKMMKENPELKFEIGGHTDSDGTAERNNTLSQERSEAVKKQMLSMGISEDRLNSKGYGTSKPLAENNNPENKAKNRRVEFVKME